MPNSPLFVPAEIIAQEVELIPGDFVEESVLNFIKAFNVRNTCSPSLQEICTFLGERTLIAPSKGNAHRILESLENDGKIFRPTIPGQQRKSHARIIIPGAELRIADAPIDI